MNKNQGGLSPEQFNKLATKKDLKLVKDDVKLVKDDLKCLDKKVDKITISLLVTKEDLSDLKKEMATKDDINKIITILDGIVKQRDDFKTEFVSNKVAHNRMQKEINETRTKVGLRIKSTV
jgi:hypothetical protein